MVVGILFAFAGIVALVSIWEPGSASDKAGLFAIVALVLSVVLIRFGMKKNRAMPKAQ